ncbi:hypothetical protein [Listeria farberi]|nr:hypothetical protein [Listeria farberi]
MRFYEISIPTNLLFYRHINVFHLSIGYYKLTKEALSVDIL